MQIGTKAFDPLAGLYPREIGRPLASHQQVSHESHENAL
jgi:hypothetical protein